MEDARDEAIGKLSKALMVLSGAVLLLAGVFLFFSFSEKPKGDAPVQVMDGEDKPTEIYNPSVAAVEMFGYKTDYNLGKKLFKMNCASCHSTSDRTLTGPGLKGVFQRIPSEEWFMAMVLKQDSLKAAKDPYLMKRLADFNNTVMTNFSYLSKEDVAHIGGYLKEGERVVYLP